MSGFVLAEQGKPVAGLAPVDIGGAAKTSDYFSMENYSHASIIVYCGIITNAATITVEESDDNAGSDTTAIAFKYYKITEGVTGDRTAATNAGFSTGTDDGSMFVIEIDAADLSDGYPYLVVKTNDAGANLIAIVPILSGSRYAQAAPPEALT
jgi:hypothetical protein